MTKTFYELQDAETAKGLEGYTLKSNDQIIKDICEFGHGETEFHTVDVTRLVNENIKMRELLESIITAQYDHKSSLANLNSAINNAFRYLPFSGKELKISDEKR